MTFHNLDPNIKPKRLIDALKWKMLSKRPKWQAKPKLVATDIPPQTVYEQDIVRVSYVGHVTFLIQTAGLNILTDPLWSRRASPFSFIGPNRIVEPGINFDHLPKIDLILISHNHYDHLDIPTVKRLWKRDKPEVITPLKNDSILSAKIPDIKVRTLNWGEKLAFQNVMDIHLEPAQHWSARGIFDKNKALWGTFIITTQMGSICFIGDSGYNESIFTDIGTRHDILLSLIPIGAYEPRSFMKDVHMNPEEAVLVHQHLCSKYSIASHFDTFQLADEQLGKAPQDLEVAKVKYNIAKDRFIAPHTGAYFVFNASLDNNIQLIPSITDNLPNRHCE